MTRERFSVYRSMLDVNSSLRGIIENERNIDNWRFARRGRHLPAPDRCQTNGAWDLGRFGTEQVHTRPCGAHPALLALREDHDVYEVAKRRAEDQTEALPLLLG